jgi:hypothetical protein
LLDDPSKDTDHHDPSSSTKDDNHDENDDTNTDLEALLNSVSDGEALLACRAHLQRRNRLVVGGWRQMKERQQKRQLAAEQAKQSEAVGFFWDDPDELVYYDRKRRPRFAVRSSVPDPTTKASEKWEQARQSSSTMNAATRWTGGTEYASELSSSPSSSSLESTSEDQDEDDDDDGILSDAENGGGITIDGMQQAGNPGTGSSHLLTPKNSWYSEEEDGRNEGGGAWEIPDDMASSSTYFKFDEETPSLSHSRRSAAAQRNFADPAWKAVWYARRWGDAGSSRRRSSQSKHRSMEKRLQHVLVEDRFLSNPLLAAMDEWEIAEAIQTYVLAKRKRIRSQKGTREARRAQGRTLPSLVFNETMTSTATRSEEHANATTTPVETVSSESSLHRRPPPSDDLVRDTTMTHQTLPDRQQRRKRSEKSRRAYRTRLENQKNEKLAVTMTNKKEKNGSRSTSVIAPGDAAFGFLPQEATPDAAMHRIGAMLLVLSETDSDDDCAVRGLDVLELETLRRDVELVLGPSRIAGRKHLLCTTLKVLFDLRGKCIPPVVKDDTATEEDTDPLLFKFVTQCTVAEIGSFLLAKIDDRILDLAGKRG